MTNFKKITAIVTSALMAGMTMGTAFAANYPAPFVQNGAADVAVVYGTGANVSPLDMQGAVKIQTNLKTFVTSSGVSSGGSSATGGDSFKFEKASTKFQYGRGVLDVDSSSVDDNEMPTLLADGKYMDSNNDEFDFKQSVAMDNLTLGLFDNDDYKKDTPTVGFDVTDGNNILTYTLDFVDSPAWDNLETTDLKIMDKTYYVLDSTGNNSITLLDSAVDKTLAEGETTTIDVAGKKYEVSVEYIGETSAKLIVNDESTNKLSAGSTQRLSDNSYIGVKDVLYTSKDSGTSKVEFSVGKGKLKITNGADVEINDENLDGVNATITNATVTTNLDKISLTWKADGDQFITPDNSIQMPGFDVVKLSYGGMVYPKEETVVVTADGDDNFMLQDVTIKDTTADVYLLQGNGTHFNLVGKDDNNRIATSGNATLVFTKNTHDYFVLSYKSGDNAESYLIRATNFDDADYPDNIVDFEYMVDGVWKTLDTGLNASESVSIGSAEFTVASVSNETAKTVTLTVAGSNNFNYLYTAEGMQIALPYNNGTYVAAFNATEYTAAQACAIASVSRTIGEVNKTIFYNDSTTHANATLACSPTTLSLNFTEETKDDAIGSGNSFIVVAAYTSDGKAYISDITGDGAPYEIAETDVFRSFVSSALNTEIKDDRTGDHTSATIVYHGGESYGEFYITAPTATINSGVTQLGAVLAKDTEAATLGKNLIVVGGSCINSVAAKLLGSDTPLCGASFTAQTGVGAQEAIIKSYSSPYTTGKIALLVAGYESTQTDAAATYLITKVTDISSTYKPKSATEATIIAA